MHKEVIVAFSDEYFPHVDDTLPNRIQPIRSLKISSTKNAKDLEYFTAGQRTTVVTIKLPNEGPMRKTPLSTALKCEH